MSTGSAGLSFQELRPAVCSLPLARATGAKCLVFVKLLLLVVPSHSFNLRRGKFNIPSPFPPQLCESAVDGSHRQFNMIVERSGVV